MNPPNESSSLGRLAAGKPKNYTAGELTRRKKRLADARLKRWMAERAALRPNEKLSESICWAFAPETSRKDF